MPLPDIAARELLLRKYARVLRNLADDVDFGTLARMTAGRSGADIEEMCNDGGWIALLSGHAQVSTEDFVEALATVVMGHARASAVITEADRVIAARHEAGHALVAFKLVHADKPQRVTIVPRGDSAGATWTIPADRIHVTPAMLRDQMAVVMAGRAAERLLSEDDEFSAAGASDDRKRATAMAEHAVCEWGIDDAITAWIDATRWREDPRAEIAAAVIDELVRGAEEKATELLARNRAQLETLVARLLAVETIGREDVTRIVGGVEPKSNAS
jgi:cell division protease FtsH